LSLTHAISALRARNLLMLQWDKSNMPGTRHYYFLDSIGQGDWFSYGTTLQDVRYAVEGYAAFDGELAGATVLPDEVVFHYPKCYGGDVWEGYGIYNYKRSLAARGVKTTSIVEGLCASIATLTALGSDTVLMADAAFWMVHKPMVDAGPGANADDHAAAIVVLNKIQDQLVGRYVARSGGKLDTATAHALVNGESFLTADECLTYGFITGKLEDAPLVAPVEAAKVLNSISKTALKNAQMSSITADEKKTFLNELKEDFKAFMSVFKNEAAPAPEPAPVTNATTAVAGDSGPMYHAEAELATGVAVYSDDALTVAYPDGTYTLGDGREAVITGGAVESLADAPAADAAPEAPAANAVDADALAAANARIAELEATNALTTRKLTAAQNKLRSAVPGSAGDPTPPGAAQNLINKAGANTPAPASLITIRRS
jgi:ATP-dependent Clp protease protease subunit